MGYWDGSLGGRVQLQIAWAKLRDGAAIASKKLRSRIQKCQCGIKKLLAYEKEMNEGLPSSSTSTLQDCAATLLQNCYQGPCAFRLEIIHTTRKPLGGTNHEKPVRRRQRLNRSIPQARS